MLALLFVALVVFCYRTAKGPIDPFTGQGFRRKTAVPMVTKSFKVPRGVRRLGGGGSASGLRPPAAVAAPLASAKKATRVLEAVPTKVQNPTEDPRRRQADGCSMTGDPGSSGTDRQGTVAVNWPGEVMVMTPPNAH